MTAADGQSLQEANDAVVAGLQGKDGIGQVTSSLSASLPFVSVRVDRAAAAERGLSERTVGALVSNTMQPRQAGTVEINGRGVTVYVAAENPPATVDALRALEYPNRRNRTP